MPPETLPALPRGAWTEEILEAYTTLDYGYKSSVVALTQYDIDPGRLRALRSRIDTHHFIILSALETDGRVPQPWILHATSMFIDLIPLLDRAIEDAAQQEHTRIQYPEPIHITHSGRRGRPEIQVDEEWLHTNITNHSNLSIRKLAKLLNIDRRTLKREMDRAGVERSFSTMTDDELDTLFRNARADNPGEGWSYFTGLLRGMNIRVQQSRIRASISRIAPLRQALRPPVGSTRHYDVKRPNSVWHHDGYHKLIRWGFVIHGFVDGFDHLKIVGMRVNTNNRAETVFDLFEHIVGTYGSPSRLRGDRGGENMAVAVWMIMKKGAKRGSYLWGSSTRNTRIERLWREVGEQFARQWKAFFTRLERLHCLDADDPRHIWLLHRLFHVELQEACEAFIQKWNHHPMKGQNNMSPLDKRISGTLEHGQYADDLIDVDPAEILRYYSVNRPYSYRSRDVEADGDIDEPEDEDEEALADDEYDLEELEQAIERGEAENVRHDAIEAPEARCPFSAVQLQVFEAALQGLNIHDIEVPAGYGLLPEERIKVVGKDRAIDLNLDRWFPRAVRWVHGLEIMREILSS